MKRQSKPWSEAEESFLLCIAETQPFPDIVERYNNMARCKHRPTRTPCAIADKLRQLGLSRRSTLDHLSIRGLAELLGTNRERICYWIKAHGLKARTINSRQSAIALSDLREFAKTQPQRFYGLDPERLRYVGIDPDTIVHTPLAGVPVALKRLDTQQVYPSISEAARANFMRPNVLFDALRENRSCAGIYWERIQP